MGGAHGEAANVSVQVRASAFLPRPVFACFASRSLRQEMQLILGQQLISENKGRRMTGFSRIRASCFSL
eukprot:10444575-Alexandrium_andersonii.AAC.1